MSIRWCFRTARRAAPGARRSPPWRRVVRELGLAVESVDYRGIDDPGARVEKLVAAALAAARNRWCWWVRAWAATCRPPPRPRLQPRGLFLLAPAFYMPGYEAYTPQDVALPDRHRARLARRHRAGREQHSLGARASGSAARAQLGSSAGRSDRGDLHAAARLSRRARSRPSLSSGSGQPVRLRPRAIRGRGDPRRRPSSPAGDDRAAPARARAGSRRAARRVRLPMASKPAPIEAL